MIAFRSTSHPQLDSLAESVAGTLARHGHTAYFAGGCVRDALRGAPVKDIDIATSATPDEVAALFSGRSLAVGKSFGVMTVLEGGIPFDVATFRRDGGYQDGRHPDGVVFDSAEHDAQRRDFTVNALFYDPRTGRVIDYVGGRRDLEAGIIRAVGDPLTRFREDRLRLMRAVRFAAVCGWTVEPATLEALRTEAPHLGCVSAERIRTEFLRTLCEAIRPGDALRLLRETGLLAAFFPELLRLAGCQQDPRWHPEGDVWEHTCLMLDLLKTPRTPELVWAVLLHDIGKPDTLVTERAPDGTCRYRTPNHAPAGAAMVPGILKRFKESRAMTEAVTEAVRYHMQFSELPKMRRSTLRQVLGRAHIREELELHRVDCLASHGKLDCYAFALEKLRELADEPVLPPPLVTGRDLIALGFRPGPAMGALLKRLYEAQLEGSGRDALLRQAAAERPSAD